ncbi:hypothetical protein HanRHA438_Chr12g0543211 [Helianthus annuus]|nr:hypothetical protein HanRHA438_Chr12g0543211 [Helianthus annuus]
MGILMSGTEKSSISEKLSWFSIESGIHSPLSSSTQTLKRFPSSTMVTTSSILFTESVSTPTQSDDTKLSSGNRCDAWMTLPKHLPTESKVSLPDM